MRPEEDAGDQEPDDGGHPEAVEQEDDQHADAVGDDELAEEAVDHGAPAESASSVRGAGFPPPARTFAA